MVEFAVGDGEWVAAATGEVIVANETDVLKVRGLGEGDSVSMFDTVVSPSGGSERRIHLAPLSVIGEATVAVRSVSGVSRGEVELLLQPSKLRRGEFELIIEDLERVWSGLILGDRSSARALSAVADVATLWVRVHASIASILDAPYAPLARFAGSTPYVHARNIDFRPTARLALGLATKTRLPSVTARPQIDNPANRMVALLLDRFVRAADLAGARPVAEHARVMRRHPTLAGLRSELFTEPPRAALRDQRYARCLHALRKIAEPPVLLGPGERPIALLRMCEIYEYWVYLQTILAMEQLAGPPLEPGYLALGRQVGRESVRLELPHGCSVAFPGDVHVTFCPSIPRGRAQSGTFAYVSPIRDWRQWEGGAGQHVTPDVVVRGPGGIVVLDAKYLSVQHLDGAARKIHAKYARITPAGAATGRVHAVIAVHPHVGNHEVDYAGYAALPLAPGYQAEWLPERLSVVL